MRIVRSRTVFGELTYRAFFYVHYLCTFRLWSSKTAFAIYML